MVLGPALGGAAVTLPGPVTTATADAVSYLLAVLLLAVVLLATPLLLPRREHPPQVSQPSEADEAAAPVAVRVAAG